MIQENLSAHRIKRLSQNQSLLGQPDIISIKQTKTSSSFFNKDKKIEDLRQNYINGLIFPTTAHFSSFISSRYNIKQTHKVTIQAQLYMFDAFYQHDIHIQICIPGSLQAKVFNLRGQQITYKHQNYQRAYFSSFLRSIRPMNYPQIILYPLINRLQILRPIIKNFVSFSFKNQLRQLHYQFQGYKNINPGVKNVALDLLVKYCLQSNYYFLMEIILNQVKKNNIQKYNQLDMLYKFYQKKYSQLLFKTSQKLLLHSNIREYKEFQIKILFQIKKYQDIALIGFNLLQSGGTKYQISKKILFSLVQLKQDKKLLKYLNVIHYFIGKQISIQKASYMDNNKTKITIQKHNKHIKNISQYTYLCFPFDNYFYNRLSQYSVYLQLLKNHAKQGNTYKMISKIQESLQRQELYIQVLIYLQKCRGWKNILKTRGECFWLQNDFKTYQQSIKNNDNFNCQSSFFQQSFQQYDKQQSKQQPNITLERQLNQQLQNKIKHQSNKQNNHNSPQQFQNSFDGNLSQIDQAQSYQMPPASTRIGNIQGIFKKKGQNKVICGSSLQNLFCSVLQDLRLQGILQNWQSKMNGEQPFSFPLGKRQIASMIYLKKGFLHKKLMRNKKSEQSFKLARKLSSSYGLSLVATYQLILLYIQKKNTRGVQFYLIQLISLLKGLGVETFDIVPEWCKPIINYVLQYEGITILKNLHSLFKAVFYNFLRCNYTEAEVQKLLYTKNDKKNEL